MLLILAASAYATDPTIPIAGAAALELAAVVYAVLLRHLARRRWSDIDWMLCRPDAATRAHV